MKKQVPINVWNLGSPAGVVLNFARKSLWARMTPAIARTAAGLPVFLVNEAQMDYLYPPERRRAIDPECLRDKLKSLDPHEDQDPLEELEECRNSWDRYSVVVAAGLYIRLKGYNSKKRQDVLDLGAREYMGSEASMAFFNEFGAAVVLCPERILNWAKNSQVPPDLLLDNVYYHELGHAYMDTLNGGPDPYNELWGRTVEESLANWIALKLFKDSEAVFVHRLILGEPAEYRGCTAVGEHLFPAYKPGLPPHFFFEDWFDYLRWLDRRGILRASMIVPWGPWNPGRINVHSWRNYKKDGAPLYPEIVRAWKQFARLLLEEAVAVP